MGEVQECPSGKGDVQEVHSCPAENFLTDNDAKSNSQPNFPKRDARRKGEWKQHACDEETLVDLMTADNAENELAGTSDRHADDVDREEEKQPMNHAPDDSSTEQITVEGGRLRVVNAQPIHDRVTPAFRLEDFGGR